MQQGLLPLFPLEVVLMPGAHLPLHIFEERYKEMIGEAVRDKTEFGIIFATSNGIAETGCTAMVEGVLQTYPDGRMDIVTVGKRRFELLLINEERNFLRGSVEFFDDDENAMPAAPDDLKAAIEAYNALQAIWKNNPFEDAGYADPKASFRLARAIRDPKLRQALLISRNEAERMHRLAQFLPELATRVQQEELMKQVSPRNGVNGNGYIH
jgi:Lon protease-like protein